MSTKLTLNIDAKIIRGAKEYAKSQGKSLSKLIEEYLNSVSSADLKESDINLSPITTSLFGAVKIEDKDFDEKRLLKDEILRKHL